MTTIAHPPTIQGTISDRMRDFDRKRMALFVEIYAAGRADERYGRSTASTPETAELLDAIHAAWMDGLCATSAGLLPFDDSRDEHAPDWLRRVQEAKE